MDFHLTAFLLKRASERISARKRGNLGYES